MPESELTVRLRGRGRPLILDGGLATELERFGADLSGGLWSARVLRDRPELVEAVHRAYLDAGADVIIAATYQASVDGFVAGGSTEAEAVELIQRGVEIARQARDDYLADTGGSDRARPLVAASVGPYGAARADGSEYTGNYDLDRSGLERFHRGRLEILCAAEPDLLAVETIPSAEEAAVVAHLLQTTVGPAAWVAFSSRDAGHIADGTPIVEAVRPLIAAERIVAVGVNCLPPQRVEPLLSELGRVWPRSLVAYPNSGETWDAPTQTWTADRSEVTLADLAPAWRDQGARLIGGCCRTGPRDIAALHRALART